MSGMSAHPMTEIGTHPWTERTGGNLTPRERRHLLRPLAAAHLTNLSGRLAGLLRIGPGGRGPVPVDFAAMPDSGLARSAESLARQRLTPALLNHSYRTFAFGSALGRLSGLDVDEDLLFASAMLHDLGLTTPTPRVDFTLVGARAARDLAEQAGLSTTATQTLLTAITLHHSPGVCLAHGPVAYLLSAGAGLDVVGLRAWTLPAPALDAVLTAHPRLGFKREFTAAFRTEAAHVPAGRAAFLRRYGAFSLAIRLAPFRD